MLKDVKSKKMQVTKYIPVSLKDAVECKLPILEEEIQNVIKLDAKACVNQIVSGENEIRYDGRVIFTALLGGVNLKKCEMGVEFSYRHELQGVNLDSNVLGYINCENVRAQVINGIPVVSSTLQFIGEALVNEDFEYFSDAENLQLKKVQVENACVLEIIKKDFDLEDEFDLDYTVTEVLCHNQNVKVFEVNSTIGAVSISGEVELNYLCLNGEEKPVLDKRVIPFVFETDAKTAYPELLAESSLFVKDAQIKVFVDENKNKSTVSVIMKLNSVSQIIENQPVYYIEDAFSCDNYLTLDKTAINTYKSLGVKTIEKTVNHRLNIEFEKNTLLICPLFAKIEDIELVANNDIYKINGVIQAGMLLSTDGSYLVETSLIPFETSVEKDGCDLSIVDKTVCDLELIESGSQITANLTLRLRVKETLFLNCNMVTAVDEGEKRVKSNSAISVFIPKKGDTLWDVCKSLGIDEQSVLKVNGDLTFPTSGEERIVIYKELK